MPIPTRTTLEALVEDGAWLRRLARGLVRDPHLAEDAVQETFAAAVERAPEAGPSRGWLARVLRNALNQERRGRGRREAREALVAAARGDVPSAADTAARLSIQRAVLEAVEALEEPYRTAIVLRYLDGLPPREVARRTGAPVKTVHTRLERGLARLRGRLDATGGGRTAWMGALVPLGLGRRALPLWTLGLGAAVMDAKLKWAGGVAAVALAGVLLQTSSSPPALEPPPVLAEARVAPELVEESAPVLVEEVPSSRTIAERQRVIEPAPEPTAAAPASPAAATIAGRVLDAEGRPVGRLTITYRSSGTKNGASEVDEPTTQSGADGRFELPLAEHGQELVAQSEEWVTVGAPVVSRGQAPEQEPVVTVAPRRDYAGLVVDAEGLPVPDARLTVVMRDAVRHELVGRYVTYATHVPQETSGERGEFGLERVGWTEGSSMRVTRAGYQDLFVSLPPDSDLRMRLVLPALGDADRVLRGRVLDLAGDPVPDAWVSCGMSATESEDDGGFVLELMQGEEPEAIRAAKRGHLPAVALLGPPEDWPASLELVVGDPPLALAGIVVDERGDPVPGALVWLLDKTEFGFVPLEMNGERFSVERSLEELVSPGIDRIGTVEAKADPRGHFRLGGLLARGYRVVAVHPGTLADTPPRSFEAGDHDVRLVLPSASTLERVAGRVLSLAGDPLEGVEVRAKREIRDGDERLGEKEREPSLVTDAEGRFAFEGLVTDGLVLQLDGALISRSQEAPELGADLEDLELRVAAKRYFRVELADPSLASYVGVHDAADRPLTLVTHEANLSLAAERFHLDEGRSAVLEADESAAFVVLHDAERNEVQRVPIRLAPSLEVQVIRL